MRQLLLFVSLLSHVWLIHFYIHLLYQSYLGLCQAICVQSHQGQTIPTVANEVSKPLCCRLNLTLTMTSEYLSLYIIVLLYWSLYNYAAHAADILTPTSVVQGVDNHSLGLYYRCCYCLCVCWGRSSRIVHFSRWLCQFSTVLTKDESPHTGYTFTPWVVYLSPHSIEHFVGGTSILRLIQRTTESHENDSRNPDRTAWQAQCLGTGSSTWANHPSTGPAGWLLNLS